MKSRSFYELGDAEFPPHVGIMPWGPVLDNSLSMPYYEGWNEKDWIFLKSTPEELVKRGEFNRELKYMAGVTTQEAAHFICKYICIAWNYALQL
jgi:neuroligin